MADPETGVESGSPDHDAANDAVPGVAIERFVSELVRWATRPEVSRSMRASGHDLSATDEWLMRHLYEVGPVRFTELAAFQSVDKSTVTAQVRRLEDNHLVLRATDPTDRRAVLVRLSAKGRRVHQASVARAQDVLDSLVEGWSESDRSTLARLLTRLTHELGVTATSPTHDDSPSQTTPGRPPYR